MEKVLRMRAVLCPLKIRFAKVLAEHGLVAEATHYVLEAKALVGQINALSGECMRQQPVATCSSYLIS